jgi:hypothetical protein
MPVFFGIKAQGGGLFGFLIELRFVTISDRIPEEAARREELAFIQGHSAKGM